MANRFANLDGTKKIKDEYTKINTGFDGVETDIGDLSSLNTTNKSNVVAAINEVDGELSSHEADTAPHPDAEDLTASQSISATNTDDATSSVDAPLKTAGGLAVAKNAFFGDSQHLPSGYVISQPNKNFVGFGLSGEIEIMRFVAIPSADRRGESIQGVLNVNISNHRDTHMNNYAMIGLNTFFICGVNLRSFQQSRGFGKTVELANLRWDATDTNEGGTVNNAKAVVVLQASADNLIYTDIDGTQTGNPLYFRVIVRLSDAPSDNPNWTISYDANLLKRRSVELISKEIKEA